MRATNNVLLKKLPSIKTQSMNLNHLKNKLTLRQLNLLHNRGELIKKKARLKVEDGYRFKKGRSRSKIYATAQPSSTPKRMNLDKEMRGKQIVEIGSDDKLKDIFQTATIQR